MAGSASHPIPNSRQGLRSRLLPDGIRGRIYFIVLVTLLPLALLVLGSSLARFFSIGKTALHENQQAARVDAAAFAAYVQDIRHQELAVGTAISTRGQFWGWTSRYLATAARQYPSLRNLSWIAPDGTIMASSMPSVISRNVYGSAPIRQLFAGRRRWVVSDLLPNGPVSKADTIVVAQAFRSDTGLLGIVAAEIDPNTLGAVLPNSQHPVGSTHALFDRQGRLVFSSLPRQGTWGERADWHKIDPLLNRTLNKGVETDGRINPPIFDKPQYASYIPDANTGYVAGVVRPTVDVTAPIRHSLRQNLLLVLLFTGLVGLIAYGTSSTIIAPVDKLRAEAERLGRGEAVPPSAEKAPGELRALRQAMTATSFQLIQRIDTLETDHYLLTAIIEDLPVGARYVNADGEVILANRIAREILGEGAPGVTSTSRGRFTLHQPDGSPLSMTEIPLIRALREGQVSRNVELIIRYENGDGILALFSANPVRDAADTVTGVVEVVVEVVSDAAVLQDIAESSNLEEQLADARAQMQALLPILPVGVCILDAHGRIISANAECTRLWGGRLPEVNSTGDFRYFHGWWPRSGDPLRPEDWPAVRALTRNETITNEVITLNRFDGLRGDVSTSAIPLRDEHGAVTGAIWVLQETMTRK